MRKRYLVLFVLAACSIPDKNLVGADAAAVDALVVDAVPAAVLTILGEPLTITDPIIGASSSLPVMIKNEGDLAATGIQISDDSAEVALTNNCGASLGAGQTCTVNVAMNAVSIGAKSVTLTVSGDGGIGDSATIAATAMARVTVTMNLVNGTTGRVQSSPAGIDCTTGVCSALFSTSPVVLTATDDGNGTLADWGVTGCATTATCSLAVTTASASLTAVFQAPWTYVTADAMQNQFEGVAIDTDGSVIAVGSVGNAARATRIIGGTGTFSNSFTYSSGAVTYYRDVAINSNGIFVTGEATGAGYDAILKSLSAGLVASDADLVTSASNDTGWGIAARGNQLIWIGGYSATNTFVKVSAAQPINELSFPATYHGRDAAVSPLDGTMWAIAGTAPNAWVGRFAWASGNAATVPASQTYTGRAFNRLVMDAEGNLIIAGWVTSPDDDFTVWKLSPTFTEVWPARTIQAAGAGHAWAVDLDPFGNIVAVGNSGGGCLIVKLRGSDGTEVFRRTIAASTCYGVASDAVGIVVVGFQDDVTITRKSFARRYFH